MCCINAVKKEENKVSLTLIWNILTYAAFYFENQLNNIIMERKIKTILVYILLAVGIVALFAIPADDSQAWFTELAITKAVAAVSFYALSIILKTKFNR